MSTEDEKAEACRTVLALARASLGSDEEAARVLLDGAGERELRALVLVAAVTISDFLIRLSVAHALLGEDEGAFLSGGAVTGAVLAQPELRAAVDQTIAAAQARLIGG